MNGLGVVRSGPEDVLFGMGWGRFFWRVQIGRRAGALGSFSPTDASGRVADCPPTEDVVEY